MPLERPQREVIVGRDKDDLQRISCVHGIENVETAAVGKLNIEKYKLRLMAIEDVDRGASRTGFAHDTETGLIRQQMPELAARGRFVVHQNNANHAGVTEKGTRSSMLAPPSSAFRMKNC